MSASTAGLVSSFPPAAVSSADVATVVSTGDAVAAPTNVSALRLVDAVEAVEEEAPVAEAVVEEVEVGSAEVEDLSLDDQLRRATLHQPLLHRQEVSP